MTGHGIAARPRRAAAAGRRAGRRPGRRRRPAARAHRLRRPGADLQDRGRRGGRAAGPRPGRRPRRAGRDRRRLRLRQVDAAQHPLRARRADRRHRPGRRLRPAGDDAPSGGCATGGSTVGFVWQQTGRNLLPYLTARENVELPMRLAGARGRGAPRARRELLDLVGVGLLRRPPARPDERRRAAAGRDRGRAGQRPGGALRRRADRRAGRGDRRRRCSRRCARSTPSWASPSWSSPTTRPSPTQVRRTVAIRDGRTASEVRRTSRAAAPTARTSWSARSTRCSTGPAGCSCRRRSWTRSSCATGSGSTWSPTTSRSGRRDRRAREGAR